MPPTELIEFIKRNKPPIYIGFGSMKDINAFTETFEIIERALEITNQRAVVGLGWSSLTYLSYSTSNS